MDRASLRRIRALINKEFLQIVRDPSSILIGVIMPLILLFLYGCGLSLDMNHLRVGVLVGDTAPDALDFVQSLYGSHYFDLHIATDRGELDKMITRGEVGGFVEIPPWFSTYREQTEGVAPIFSVADGSEPNTASFVQNYLRGAWLTWQQQNQISQGSPAPNNVALEPRFWYNEELRSRDFLIPGSLAIIMALVGTLLTALVVSREWERGTMEALMSTPVTIWELLIGKLVPYFLFAMLSMGMCVVVATIIYQIPFRGSFWLLAVVTAAFLTAALSLGLLISTLARNQFLAAQLSQVTAFLPAFMLSGFIFEISSMPAPIRLLSRLFPPRYFVSSLQTLFLAGDVWRLIGIDLLAMISFGAILLFVTSRISHKRLD